MSIHTPILLLLAVLAGAGVATADETHACQDLEARPACGPGAVPRTPADPVVAPPGGCTVHVAGSCTDDLLCHFQGTCNGCVVQVGRTCVVEDLLCHFQGTCNGCVVQVGRTCIVEDLLCHFQGTCNGVLQLHPGVPASGLDPHRAGAASPAA